MLYFIVFCLRIWLAITIIETTAMILFYIVPGIFFAEHTVAQLVEALRYKPEGWGFDSR
jgi:hypothetical protein